MFTIMQNRMPDVVIIAGQTDVDLNWAQDYFDAEAITIVAPAGLAETVTFTGAADGVTFATVQDTTATAVKGPTAGALITYNGVFSGLSDLKIHLSAPAGANRTFQIFKSWRAGSI